MFRRGADRGQSELIGIVLLFGLVVITATSVFVIGGIAINDVSQEVDLERALTEMRQADSRMSRVAFGQQGGQVVVFGESDSAAEVKRGSSLTVTMNGNASCRADITMGSIVKHVEDGGTVAYEGGGVWRETDGGGVTMVSPPDLQYRNGSVTFPMVSLANASTGQVNSLEVRENETASRERNREIRDALSACYPPKNMTITIQSDYYKGWGSYMESRIASNITYDHDDRTVTTTLDRLGGTWSADNSSVQVDRNFTASVEVLGTELSGVGYNYFRGYYITHAPITMSVIVDGEPRSPWPASPTMSADDRAIQYNVNDPDNPEEYSYRFTGEGGTNITVEATSYFGSDYEWADNETERNGYTYDQVRPRESNGERITIDSDDADEKNLLILRDGDTFPTWAEAASYQRDMEEMLGSDRIGENEDGEKIVELEENQAVFIYELSTEVDNYDEARGSGDPDFNDAVVLFELEQADQAEQNFYVHVTVSQVQVSEGG